MQIVLSLFNLYGGWSGKLVLLGLFGLAAGCGLVVKLKVIDPQLAAERQEAEAQKATEAAPKDGAKPNGAAPKKANAAKGSEESEPAKAAAEELRKAVEELRGKNADLERRLEEALKRPDPKPPEAKIPPAKED